MPRPCSHVGCADGRARRGCGDLRTQLALSLGGLPLGVRAYPADGLEWPDALGIPNVSVGARMMAARANPAQPRIRVVYAEGHVDEHVRLVRPPVEGIDSPLKVEPLTLDLQQEDIELTGADNRPVELFGHLLGDTLKGRLEPRRELVTRQVQRPKMVGSTRNPTPYR